MLVRMSTVLSIFVNRHGTEALTLTEDELNLLRDEVRIDFEEFNPRSYSNEGIEVFEIIRSL